MPDAVAAHAQSQQLQAGCSKELVTDVLQTASCDGDVLWTLQQVPRMSAPPHAASAAAVCIG